MTTDKRPWPPRCDCCNASLPTYPSEIYPGERSAMPLCNGVGIYCDPCDIAIDRWTGGRRLRPDGLPQRCPDHLNPCRLAEVNERNLEELEEEFKAKRDRPAGAAVEALLSYMSIDTMTELLVLLSYLPIDTMPELPRLLKLLALLEETLVGLDKTT